MSKILRINTEKLTFTYEAVPTELAGLGGRALTSKMVLNEVPATCHPLGAANKLIMAPGILTGSPAANSGRLSVGAKSPLTGGIKESNSGDLFSKTGSPGDCSSGTGRKTCRGCLQHDRY